MEASFVRGPLEQATLSEIGAKAVQEKHQGRSSSDWGNQEFPSRTIRLIRAVVCHCAMSKTLAAGPMTDRSVRPSPLTSAGIQRLAVTVAMSEAFLKYV